MTRQRLGDLRFAALYALCLGACLGSIVAATAEASPDVVEDAPSEVTAYVELPPKPDGAGAQSGDGEGVRYTEEVCARYSDETRDSCMHALALQRAPRDPEGALQACDTIEQLYIEKKKERQLRFECMSDVAELHALVDRDRSEAICPTIPRPKWRDQCLFGIALAWSQKDYGYARQKCTEAGRWRRFCLHDVNGEIAEVDPDAALGYCDAFQESEYEKPESKRDETLVQMCYHGLGKYIGRILPTKARAVCERIDTGVAKHAEQCHHGLGWAIAETKNAAAVADCPPSGDFEDNCVLGVSAYVVTFNADEGRALCDGVGSKKLARSCRRWAEKNGAGG